MEFQEAPEGESVLWKYMDLTKFVSLLEKEALFFSQVAGLSDAFEGSIPSENLTFRDLRKGDNSDTDSIGQYRKLLNEELRYYTFVDCWHINELESVAMWDLYTTRGNGIAITTTVEQYMNSLENSGYETYAGALNYIDYRNESAPRYSSLSPAFHKRKSYEHENEFRGAIQEVPRFLKAAEYHRNSDILKTDIENYGQTSREIVEVDYVPIDIDEMINEVYISPGMDCWQESVVKTVTESLSELSKDDVKQSNLNDDPVY
ncbi:hypothetical protein [Halomarina oriensis]|uniref:DUF2971 domain-containing protein n=1 Tax=Halomarina oriensis TaxID=671145 RepID=A0A6B0GH31_9EURY|nr:hypothetical protein [Halomarina oriensis]MWG34166.1 hypothetical protein [Halomarina oriensis]